MIVVVDCGMGNLQSVVRAFRAAGSEAVVSSKPGDIAAAHRIVLPGVGSLGHGMTMLESQGLLPVLREQALGHRVPVLGICVGHQMLSHRSEEGAAAGLGWIDGETRRLRADPPDRGLKIPHLGWNTLEVEQPCALLDGIAADACFYFAHSFGVQCADRSCVAATTRYGCEFVSVVQRDNIFGVQFHPEKSQANGIRVLANFLAWRDSGSASS